MNEKERKKAERKKGKKTERKKKRKNEEEEREGRKRERFLLKFLPEYALQKYERIQV